MDTTDFRALCAQATEHLSLLDDPPHQLVIAMQAALAQPAPEPPTDEELLRLYQVATPCYSIKEYRRELDFARAVLARWGQGNGILQTQSLPAPLGAGQ
jgi:hypothetical protein